MRRTTIVTLTGLALVGVLTACGSAQPGEAVPAAGSGQAAPATTSAPGGGGAASGPLESLTGKAVEAMKVKKTAKISVSGSGPGAEAIGGNGQIRLDGNDLSMAMTSKVPGEDGQPAGETKLLFVGNTLYVEPPKDMPVPPGKKWMKIDPKGTDVMSKLLGPLAQQMRDSADPKVTFQKFGDGGTLGGSTPTTLDGAPATQHKIDVDLNRLIAKTADPLQKLSLELLVKNGVTSMTYDFWTDAQNLPLQFQFSQKMPNAPAATTVTAKYTAWGEPVDIKAPADSEIAPPVELPQPPR
ncbi:hypothetical protein [Allokutzneria albata]|uniref:Lipoprotein LprG n=1 Tax=Allokutzneria albata TaxID=211114 RepID=A0A1H0BH69_ALLAB|nr:hypothetical protein [Allokutzneria albata]SDN44972.1 hypothetical protein SAMN04489726_6667 [Allokutzneria albata]